MRAFLLLLLLLGLVWQADRFVEQKITHHIDTLVADYTSVQAKNKTLSQAKSSLVYVLDTDTWTDFPLLPNTKLLKILSNVSLNPRILNQDKNLPIHYRLQYQVVDANGQVLLDKDYYHRSRLSLGSSVYLFYLLENEYVTQGRFLLINFSKFTPKQLLGATLRLRYQSNQVEAENVVARVYSQESADHTKLYYLWQRLSERQRTILANKTLYPADLLYDEEKQNLLRHYWAVLGPAGIFEQDYFSRHLYQMQMNTQEAALEDTATTPLREGLYVDTNHHITINLAQAQTLQLQRHADSAENHLYIKHYSREGVHAEQSTQAQVETHFEAGLLDIHSQYSSQLKVLTPSEDNPDEMLDVTPELPKSKTFLINTDQTLTYQISHNSKQKQATPIRFVARLLLDKNQAAPTNCQLSYQLQDKNQKTIDQHRITLSTRLSLYDRTLGALWETHSLSEVQRYYLVAMPQTHSLVFTSTCPTLVSVYNRPARLGQLHIHNSQTPDNQQTIPNWFRLNPDNATDLYLQQRQIMIHVQTPPPTMNRTDDNKKWQTLTPLKAPPARYLLSRREDSEASIEAPSLGVYYRKFRANKTYNVHFSGTQALLKPQLVFKRGQKKVQTLQMWVDGQLYFKQEVYTYQGQLSLPQLSAGKHRIQFKLKGDGDFYINQIRPVNGAETYLKRLVHPLSAKGLRFAYHKPDDNAVLLSARLYLPYPQKEAFRLKVSIQAHKGNNKTRVYEGWTFTQREHLFLPDNSKSPSITLNNQRTRLDGGQLFVIPLQQDLSAGDYSITIQPHQGHHGAYLSLGQQQNAQGSWHQIFQETVY